MVMTIDTQGNVDKGCTERDIDAGPAINPIEDFLDRIDVAIAGFGNQGEGNRVDVLAAIVTLLAELTDQLRFQAWAFGAPAWVAGLPFDKLWHNSLFSERTASAF
jgi:hypothetical protein